MKLKAGHLHISVNLFRTLVWCQQCYGVVCIENYPIRQFIHFDIQLFQVYTPGHGAAVEESLGYLVGVGKSGGGWRHV